MNRNHNRNIGKTDNRYREGRNDPVIEHPAYRNRTETGQENKKEIIIGGEFEGMRRDPRMGENLRQAYLSELGAVISYTYRATISDAMPSEVPDGDGGEGFTQGVGEHIAEIFEEISEVEMMHYRTLGELMLALGANPDLRARLNVVGPEIMPSMSRWPWGDKTNRRVLAAFLRQSVKEEQSAAAAYQNLAGKTKDPVLRKILLKFAADEELHAGRFASVEADLQDEGSN